MKQTKAAQKELNKIQEFVSGFQVCKGHEPEILFLSKKQVEVLGAERGELILGKPWEIYK